MARKRFGMLVVAATSGVLPLALTGCLEDKEKQAEIERLGEEVERLQGALDAVRGDLEAAKGDLQDAIEEADKAQEQAADFKGQLADAERDLKRFRDAEARAEAKAAEEPSLRDKLEQSKEQVTASLAALVTIEGDKTKGRGFVVEADGKSWLYTAPEVLAGNTKLEVTAAEGGSLKRFGAFELAADSDLVRLEILDEVEHKLKVGEVSTEGRLLGLEAGGNGLVEGRAYQSEGPAIKVDSRISGADVGTPVFDGETGGLRGLVTEVRDERRDLWGAASSYRREQRVVCRLDRDIEWVAIEIGSFLTEARRIEDFDRLTRLVTAFARIEPGPGPLNLDATAGGGQSVRQLFEENKSVRPVVDLLALEEWLADRKMKPSESDMQRRFGSIFGQVAAASRRQLQDFAPASFSPYHRAAAEASLGWRKQADEELAKVIAKLGG